MFQKLQQDYDAVQDDSEIILSMTMTTIVLSISKLLFKKKNPPTFLYLRRKRRQREKRENRGGYGRKEREGQWRVLKTLSACYIYVMMMTMSK